MGIHIHVLHWLFIIYMYMGYTVGVGGRHGYTFCIYGMWSTLNIHGLYIEYIKDILCIYGIHSVYRVIHNLGSKVFCL